MGGVKGGQKRRGLGSWVGKGEREVGREEGGGGEWAREGYSTTGEGFSQQQQLGEPDCEAEVGLQEPVQSPCKEGVSAGGARCRAHPPSSGASWRRA